MRSTKTFSWSKFPRFARSDACDPSIARVLRGVYALVKDTGVHVMTRATIKAHHIFFFSGSSLFLEAKADLETDN